jgi:hypothetical protein
MLGVLLRVGVWINKTSIAIANPPPPSSDVFFARVYEKKIGLYNSKAGFIHDPLESTFGHVDSRLFGPVKKTSSLLEESLHTMKIFEGIHNMVGEVLATNNLKYQTEVDYDD